MLAALAASDAPVSGEAIAESLGLSRAAVGKHVDALQREGCDIRVLKGTGYQLMALPGEAVPAGITPKLHSPFWVEVEGGPSTESTNDDAKALAEKGAPEGTLVVASQQTGGRGRLGRTWVSLPGGAYASFVLRPPVAVADVASLALAIAVGVATGIERLGVAAAIKWPNDVLVDSEKVAGVLLEMSTEADSVLWVVAGIGLNVLAPEERFAGAAYLGDRLPDLTPATACAAVLDSVAESYAAWVEGGWPALREEYSRLDALAGREVVVRDANGVVRAKGRAAGTDDSGRLLVDGGGRVTAVASGEVTLGTVLT